VFHWGKLIGMAAGYILGGFPGAVLGLLAGFLFDRSVSMMRQPRFAKANAEELVSVPQEFITAMFSVMGCVAAAAKANFKSNANSSNGYAALNKVFDWLGLPHDRYKDAITLYKEGQQSGFNLNQVVMLFFTVSRHEPHLLELFLELQLYAVINEGEITATQKHILLSVCELFEMSRADFDRISSIIRAEHQFQQQAKPGTVTLREASANLEDAFAVLNLSPRASDEEIKKAYRRLTNIHHPDKLFSRGLPEEILKLSEEKTREVRMAYERIRAVRNF